MHTPTYLITKQFTAGVLEGLTIQEVTRVKFHVGKVYTACVGSSAYKVMACEECEPEPCTGCGCAITGYTYKGHLCIHCECDRVGKLQGVRV